MRAGKLDGSGVGDSFLTGTLMRSSIMLSFFSVDGWMRHDCFDTQLNFPYLSR